MNDQKPDKEPKKISDEDIEEILNEIKKHQKNKKNYLMSHIFMMHPNYIIHMGLSFLINLIIFAVVVGLASGLNAPIMMIKISDFIIGIILLTLIENFIKILLYRFVPKIMIQSLGVLSFMILLLILYSIDVMLTEGFHFIGVEHLMIFTVLFSLLRFGLSLYIKNYMSQRHIFKGGS